jgi:hypothetical protein
VLPEFLTNLRPSPDTYLRSALCVPGTGPDPQGRQKGCMHTFVMCVTRLWDPVGKMNCTLCKGVEWVCANHPDKPFYNSEDARCGVRYPLAL